MYYFARRSKRRRIASTSDALTKWYWCSTNLIDAEKCLSASFIMEILHFSLRKSVTSLARLILYASINAVAQNGLDLATMARTQHIAIDIEIGSRGSHIVIEGASYAATKLHRCNTKPIGSETTTNGPNFDYFNYISPSSWTNHERPVRWYHFLISVKSTKSSIFFRLGTSYESQ